MYMKFETIIFDMDGVVIDSEVLFDIADTEFLRQHNRVNNREEVKLLLAGLRFVEGTALLKERYRLPGTVEELHQQRKILLEEQYRTNLKYVPGFEKFHNKLTISGPRNCIATASTDDLLELANKKVGLTEKFGSNIFKISDVGNKSKPDPAIYSYAAERMNTNPSKCIVIEDSPKGLQASKNAGMFCIGITTTFAADRLNLADVVVSSYAEIDLNKLSASR